MADNHPVGTVARGPNGEVLVKTEGGWVRQRASAGRADPRLPAQTRQEDAQAIIAEAQARYAEQVAAANAAKAAADAQSAVLQGQVTNLQLQQGQKEASSVALTDQQRGEMFSQYRSMGNLSRMLNDLRQRAETDLGGRNPLEGRVGLLRSQDARFDSAAGRLIPFMVNALALSGQMFNSEAEQAMFIGPMIPRATDTDGEIADKLNHLDDLVTTAIRDGRSVLGVSADNDPLASNDDVAAFLRRTSPPGAALEDGLPAPTILPRAAGTSAPPQQDARVTGGPGVSRRIPELAGLAAEIPAMIQQGIPAREVAAHYRQRLEAAGVPVSQSQIADIYNLERAHRADPRVPVASLMSGFENFETIEDRRDQSQFERLLGAAADNPVGNAIIHAANAVSAGNLANVAGDEVGAILDVTRRERGLSSFVGDALGSAAAMYGGQGAAARAGLGFLGRGGGIAGDTLYGAVRGASESEGSAQDRVAAALVGAASGAGGNALGQGVVGGLGRAAQGVTNPTVRALADRGITMTPGQILGQGGRIGRGVRALENAIESVPFIGQNIRMLREEGVGDYGRAQLAENLAPIGYQPPAGQFSQDMLADAQQAVGNSYGLLNGRTFYPDYQFADDLGAALASGRQIPRLGDEFGGVMDRQIDPLFGLQAEMTGEGFQDALQTLRGARSHFANDGAMGAMAAESVSSVENAIIDWITRQAPDVRPQLDAANQAYAGLVPIEMAAMTAANQGGGGVFTPAQYGRSATANTRRFGGRAAAARGDIPGGELQRSAQEALPATIGNSGTTDRAIATMLLPASLGGAAYGGYALADDPVLAALLGTLALGSTRTGNRLATRALVDRPQAMRRAGQAISDFRTPAGHAVSAATIAALLANE